MKTTISVFLIFSFLVLTTPLTAKERRGAELLVQKTDGQQVKGELIAVKEGSLLLLSSEGADVSVDIGDIKAIIVMKKSKFLKGAINGLFLGGGVVGIISLSAGGGGSGGFSGPGGMEYVVAGIGAALGLVIGGGIGAMAGKDKIIKIEAHSEADIANELEKLRKKARIPDYN